MSSADNEAIARSLDELGDLLEAQHANPFRVRAYHNAAESVRAAATPMPQIYAMHGRDGFRELAGVGQTLSLALERLVTSGSYPLLDRLRGQTSPDAVLRTVPTIGKKTESELQAHLGIHTLRDLEEALNAGVLARVPGMGPKRLSAIRKALSERDFDNEVATKTPPLEDVRPSIEDLLVLDRQFRELAAANKLPLLAPPRDALDTRHARVARRPIWHTIRGERNYTIVFADVPSDGVTISLDDHDHGGEWTVITGRYGDLTGHRIVRGRIDECRRLLANEAKLETAREKTIDVLEQVRREIHALGS